MDISLKTLLQISITPVFRVSMPTQKHHFFFQLCWTEVNFVGPLVPSVSDFGWLCPSVSKGGSAIARALLLLACNDPQSHLWLLGPGIEPGSLTPEVSTIQLHQPDLATETSCISGIAYNERTVTWPSYDKLCHKCPNMVIVIMVNLHWSINHLSCHKYHK